MSHDSLEGTDLVRFADYLGDRSLLPDFIHTLRNTKVGVHGQVSTANSAAPSALPPADGHYQPREIFKRLEFAGVAAPRLTHYLFRYPAKFHPPVVHCLIRKYTSAGQTVLDPFCGSGTLLLAAAVEGRHAVGCDIDPVAVFVSEVKTKRINPEKLRRSWNLLHTQLESQARSIEDYSRFRFEDIPLQEYNYETSREGLWIPAIPNLFHWFRRYVIVDLSRIVRSIDSASLPPSHVDFFRLILASIVRKSSNADPIPVSGLEVTSHMRRLDAEGREINPFQLFMQAAEQGIADMEDYWRMSSPWSRILAFQADARCLTESGFSDMQSLDAVITSPPYHNAVDYYRRHQLEMYWLGLTSDHSARLRLLPKYIGRYSVRKTDPALDRQNELGVLASSWNDRIRLVSPRRADAFVHYIISMKDFVRQLSITLHSDASIILVLGNSTWNGLTLPTCDLVEECAARWYTIEEALWYPTRNRYMSYSRHNGADIGAEHVLVLRRGGLK